VMRRRRRYVLLFLLLLIVGGLVARRVLRGPAIKSGSYLLLEIGGSYTECPPQDLIASLLRAWAGAPPTPPPPPAAAPGPPPPPPHSLRAPRPGVRGLFGGGGEVGLGLP